tara:strand:- start:154 stop:354 length:201 start_codon:yes stop_codon:yes gene_type:complete
MVKQKQTPEERLGFLENEQTYLKARINKLKKDGHPDPELCAWYLKIAQDHYKKNEAEIKQLQAKDK